MGDSSYVVPAWKTDVMPRMPTPNGRLSVATPPLRLALPIPEVRSTNMTVPLNAPGAVAVSVVDCPTVLGLVELLRASVAPPLLASLKTTEPPEFWNGPGGAGNPTRGPVPYTLPAPSAASPRTQSCGLPMPCSFPTRTE